VKGKDWEGIVWVNSRKKKSGGGLVRGPANRGESPEKICTRRTSSDSGQTLRRGRKNITQRSEEGIYLEGSSSQKPESGISLESRGGGTRRKKDTTSSNCKAGVDADSCVDAKRGRGERSDGKGDPPLVAGRSAPQWYSENIPTSGMIPCW